jgi:hypothetical protein
LAEIQIGATIRNIVAGLRIVTKLPLTGSAVPHAETHLATGRLQPATRLAGRAEIFPAIAPKELAQAIGRATEQAMDQAIQLVQAIGQVMELVRAIGRVMELAQAIGPQAVERTA